MAGTTGKLKSDVADPQRKRTVLQTMTTNKFDLSAKVQHTALVGPTGRGHGYVVLVTVSTATVDQLDVPIPQNLSSDRRERQRQVAGQRPQTFVAVQ